MIDTKTLNKFTGKVNQAYQQFCVWMYSNNHFAKHQKKFNEGVEKCKTYSQDKAISNSCKYKNFWGVVIPTLQQGWVLSLARLVDTPYLPTDKKKQNPRLSIYYIVELLDDDNMKNEILERLNNYNKFISSIKEHRHNTLAHNDLKNSPDKIEAGVEDFFEELESIISYIKEKRPDLKSCNNINIKFTDKLSEEGVKEIFESIV